MKKFLIGLAVLSAVGCQPQSTPAPATSTPTNPIAPSSPLSSGSPTLVTGAQQADVQLDKESYLPGQQIEVTVLATGLSESAWVGVIPSAIAHGSEETNDDHDLSYVRVEARPLSLVAPKQPGDYDIRLHDNDDKGKEVASRSFKVLEDPSPVVEPKLLWQPAKMIAPASEITVDFEAPLGFAENAWVGIVPSATPHGEEAVNDKANIGYRHIEGRSRGRMTFTAPTEAGSYDVRMFDTDDDGKEVATVSFKVGD